MSKDQISRLRVGVDVPWVTSWSEEMATGAAPCASVSGALAITQTERPGHGRPMYSRNHMRRQRRSVGEMLCPMCGKPTPDDDRWTLTAKPETAGSLRARGLGHVLPPELADDQGVLHAGGIAPLHLACAKESSQRCPHLSADPDLELRRFPAAWVLAPFYVRVRAPGRPDAAAVSFLHLLGIEPTP